MRLLNIIDQSYFYTLIFIVFNCLLFRFSFKAKSFCVDFFRNFSAFYHKNSATMKLLLICIACTNFLLTNAAISAEKRRELMIHAITECKTKENGTNEDLSHILATMRAENSLQKCMIACGLEDFAVVSFMSISMLYQVLQFGKFSVHKRCLQQRYIFVPR
jgi:hypothetical protein